MITYDSIQELVDKAREKGKKISEICLEDQAQQMEKSQEELLSVMEKSFDAMLESARWGSQKGVKSTSGLTGGEGYTMLNYSKEKGGIMGNFVTRAIGTAMAVSNCNAAMGRIVATPTAGSCGILPGCLIPLYEEGQVKKEDAVLSMFTAGAFGMVVANKACIAGAQGGCQAECGSASGMAAAVLVELMGGTPDQCATALGIAIINQMGLVCDPVAGLVEIPCTKRNASGVVIAMSAADMALSGMDLKIPVDECIDTMRSVGDEMSSDLKETANGGLAATPTGQKLRKQVFGK